MEHAALSGLSHSGALTKGATKLCSSHMLPVEHEIHSIAYAPELSQKSTTLLSDVRVRALTVCASKQSDALIALAGGWWACLLRAYALPIGGKLGQICIRDICKAVQQPNKVHPPIHVLSLQQS